MRRLIVLLLLLATAAAVDYTWVGSGTWETPTNWSPAGVPQTDADKAIFTGGAVDNCQTTAPVTVGAVQLESGYSGTLTLGGDLSITNTGGQGAYLSMYDGIISANGFAVSTDAKTLISGGSFDAGSGNHQFGALGFATDYGMVVNGGTFVGGLGDHTFSSAMFDSGTVTLTSGTTSFVKARSANIALAFGGGGMAFSHGNGLVKFDNSVNDQILYSTSHTPRSLYNLQVVKGARTLQYYSGAGFPITVENDFTLTSGTFDTVETGSGTTWDLTVGHRTRIESSGTLTCNDATITLGSGLDGGGADLVQVVGGTLNGGSGTHDYGGIANTGSWHATSGTTTISGRRDVYYGMSPPTTHNDGTIIITSKFYYLYSNYNLYNFILQPDSAWSYKRQGADVTLTVENDFTIGSDATLTERTVGQTIDVTGNLIIDGTLDGNAWTINAGSITVNPTGTLNVQDSTTSILGGTLTETGTITFGDGSIEKQWAADVNVKGEGSNLDGAIVIFENQQSETTAPATTDANGDYSVWLSEWSRNSGGTDILEPYVVTADDAGFAGESQEMPLTSNAVVSFDLSSAGESGSVAGGEENTWVDIGSSYMVKSDVAGAFVIEPITEGQAEALCGASLPADYTFDYVFDMSCPGGVGDVSVSPSDGIATRWWHCEGSAWVDVTDAGFARVTSCSPFAGAATSGGTVYTAPALEMLDITILLALAAIVAIGAIYRRK